MRYQAMPNTCIKNQAGNPVAFTDENGVFEFEDSSPFYDYINNTYPRAKDDLFGDINIPAYEKIRAEESEAKKDGGNRKTSNRAGTKSNRPRKQSGRR